MTDFETEDRGYDTRWRGPRWGSLIGGIGMTPYRSMEMKTEEEMKVRGWGPLMGVTFVTWVAFMLSTGLVFGGANYMVEGELSWPVLFWSMSIAGIAGGIGLGTVITAWIVKELRRVGFEW